MEPTITDVPQRNLFQSVLHYGALLGLFWMFKYLFKIGEEYWKHFIYFYNVLQIGTPLLMYFFYTKYLLEKNIASTIGKALIFSIGTGICASLFENVMIFAHYAFINSSQLHTAIEELHRVTNVEQLKDIYPSLTTTEITEITDKMLSFFTLRTMLVIVLFVNTILEAILSAIFGLVIGLFPPRNMSLNKNK